MDKKESVGTLEYLLRARKYTEKERDQIIDLCEKQHGTIYDKTRGKFQRRCTYSQYGITLRSWYEDIIKKCEEKNYAV